jgi:hypothetical protein
MDFDKATDELMGGLTRATIAKGLGCSLSSVRQAKLGKGNAGRRSPPQGWEAKLAGLAEKEGTRLLRVAKALEKAANALK